MNYLAQKIPTKLAVMILTLLVLLGLGLVTYQIAGMQTQVSTNKDNDTTTSDLPASTSEGATTTPQATTPEATSPTPTQRETGTSATTNPSAPTTPANPNPPPDNPTPATPKTVTITINGSGNYSTSNLTINKGDTINWVNQDNEDHWPASNNHPVHSLYPGFDATPGIAPGGNYSFTFNNAGSWGWHDHLNTSTNGTITVQ